LQQQQKKRILLANGQKESPLAANITPATAKILQLKIITLDKVKIY